MALDAARARPRFVPFLLVLEEWGLELDRVRAALAAARGRERVDEPGRLVVVPDRSLSLRTETNSQPSELASSLDRDS